MSFFKPEDFTDCGTLAAKIANTMLEREGQIVYRCNIGLCAESWTRGEHDANAPTHKALLINIEPLGCQHTKTQMWEPHLAGARRCLDCFLVYNNNVGKWYCEHPNNKIKLVNTAIIAKNFTDRNNHMADYECECGAKLKPKTFEEVK